RVVEDFDAEVGDQLDLFHDDVAREAPLRHASPHHAARDRLLLVDGHLVALPGQLPRDRETADASADDASGQPVPGRRRLAPSLAPVIGGDALQVADADRRVDLLAPAGVLTRPSAHATEATGEDVVLPVELIRVGVAPIRDESDVA